MTKETRTDPLGRKYHVFKGAEFNAMFGGIGGMSYDDDAEIFIPASELDDKLEFPSTPFFNDLHYSVASGTVIHNLHHEKVYGPHRPPKIVETADGFRVEEGQGFAATSLSIFIEIDWYGECWTVMEAHGWISRSGGIAQRIVDYVSEEFGGSAVTEAQLAFGENWEARVAELAATRLVQPLSRLWYAVNMKALYYCHYDDLRLGYLWAEYRMRMSVEKNAIRGQAVLRSARQGGLARGASRSVETSAVISAMEKRIAVGQSISNAARLTFNEGHGASAGANKKLWHRHRPR